MTDCRNLCRDPIAFPRPVDNRPALPRVGYRIGRYADIREALLHWLDAQPALARFTHREADDPAIALLEGTAILGDILTFYQEAYANEKFLRTAAWRESVADLVRLLGYRLAPGVGGRAAFAFEVRGERPVAVPSGFRLSAELTGRDGQSDFETAEPLLAYPAFNRFALHQPSTVSAVSAGATRFTIDTAALAAAGVTLETGNRLMVASAPDTPAATHHVVVVDAVRTQFDRTEVTIKGRWPGAAATVAYKLGRSFRFFGHNAPEKYVELDASGNAVQRSTDFSHMTDLAPGTAIAVVIGAHRPLPWLASFPLDQAVDDLATGGSMLASLPLGPSSTSLSTGTRFLFERRIQRAHAETITRGAMTGGSTVVDLDATLALVGGLGPTGNLRYTDLRAVHFHEVLGQRFAIAGPRVPLAGATVAALQVYGTAEEYAALDGRRLQLARSGVVEEAVARTDAAAPATGVALRTLHLGPPPARFAIGDFPIDPPAEEASRVYAYGNLVDATQGRTEREAVLGNGDARQAFQTFKLPKAPLTYHLRAGSTPPEAPELEIFVGDRRWTAVASFFGRGPAEEIYIVREDARGESWVQFGDGVAGARLPSGLGNVRARFRTGQAAHGTLRADTRVQPGERLDRLAKAHLLGLATGGDVAESADNAREAAPGKARSLGRLVSITDYEAEALAISGVWRVSARWALVSNVPAIVLTVLMKTGRAAELAAVRSILAADNRCRGPQRYPIVVNAGRLEFVALDLSVALDPALRQDTVLAQVRETLGLDGAQAEGIDGSRGLFSAGRRRFGEREYATRIEGVAQNVPGVLWARVNGLASLGPYDDASLAPIPAAPWPLSPVLDCDPARILALHRRHLELRAVAVPQRACG